MSPDQLNDNEHRQRKESLSGSFDNLVESNLLLIKTIQEAVPVLQQAAPVTRRWVMVIAVCALATFGTSAATFVTVHNIRSDNREFLSALTEACTRDKR